MVRTIRPLLLLVLPLALLLTGCPQVQTTARDSIAAAKSFLDSEKAAHPECATTPTVQICTLLTKATGAKDATIDALEAYCAGLDFNTGGACNPPAKGTPALAQATQKLQFAVQNLNQSIADIKTITGGK